MVIVCFPLDNEPCFWFIVIASFFFLIWITPITKATTTPNTATIIPAIANQSDVIKSFIIRTLLLQVVTYYKASIILSIIYLTVNTELLAQSPFLYLFKGLCSRYELTEPIKAHFLYHYIAFIRI